MSGDENLGYCTEEIEQLLQCPICLDRFTQPKLLPCQHTFCEKPCLEQLVNVLTRCIKCPECRAEHRVPYGGVSSLPNNLTIRSFLDLPRRTRHLSGGTGDGAGGSTSTATGSGGSGGGNINDAACFSGGATGFSAEPPMAAAARTGCGICSRDAALSRCAHCDNNVCNSCKRSHMEQVKLDIARLVGQVRRGIPYIADAVTAIERKMDILREKSEEAKTEITTTIDRFIMELKARQRLLHGEVEEFLNGEFRPLRMQQDNLEVEMASIASFCDTTESTISRSRTNVSDDDLVDMKRQCVEHMENLRMYESGMFIVPRERGLQFLMEETRLSNVIATFGEIVSPLNSENQSSTSSRDSSPYVSTTGSIPSATNTSGPSFSMATTHPSPSLSVADRSLERTMALIRGPSTASNRNRLQHALSTPTFTSTSEDPDFNYQRRVNRNDGSSAGRSSPLPRRTLQERRRQHMSDTRLTGLISSSGLGGGGSDSNITDDSSEVTSASQALRNRRNTRSLSTGATLFGIGSSGSETPGRQNQQAETIPEESIRSPARRRRFERSNTFTREDSSNGDDNGRVSRTDEGRSSRVSSADARLRSRPSVRFDVSLQSGDNEDDSIEEEGFPHFSRISFPDNESTRVDEAVNNYREKGRAIVRFGTRGNDQMEFTWPRGVAISRDDQILVADSSNHRVQVFDSVGRFVRAFGSYGQGDGEFDCLAGVAVNSFGQMIISDRYNHRIQVYDHHGNFQLAFGQEGIDLGQLLYPWGVACDNMGFIYVCDKENHRVQVFQSNGRFVRAFGSLGHRSGHFENPHYLAISPDNKIYVSDSSNHRIQVFSMYGDFLFSFGSPGTMEGQMRYPKGIAVDEQGFVIVADGGNNRIQVFHGDGRFHCMFGTYGSDNGKFKGLEGVTILSNGNLVVSDRENHRIQIF